MQATELVVKINAFLDEAESMYREEVFEDMKIQWSRFENIIFQVRHIAKSKFAKIYKKINIRNGKSENFCLYCLTAKHGKAYDFIDSEYI